MAELRSFIFIDQLQPRTMCYLGTWIRGSLPRTNMAAQIIEVAPGLDIESLTDVALKHAEVQGGILVVERQFGYLEIHSRSTAAVRAPPTPCWRALGPAAGQGDEAADPGVEDRHPHRPSARLPDQPQQARLDDPAGESLFVLEMQPAAYAILATNEAEKAADIKVVDFRMMGATGRVYLSGTESNIGSGRRRAAALETARRPRSIASPARHGARRGP